MPRDQKLLKCCAHILNIKSLQRKLIIRGVAFYLYNNIFYRFSLQLKLTGALNVKPILLILSGIYNFTAFSLMNILILDRMIIQG